jgi:hypothetical protein
MDWLSGAAKVGTLLAFNEIRAGPPRAAAGRPQAVRCARSRSTAACSNSSGVVSDMRKNPSPLGPYIDPGETTTAASSRTSSANEAEVWPAGTGAQT